MYYFAFGRSKNDWDGYQQALAAWKSKKEVLDNAEEKRPREHEEDYGKRSTGGRSRCNGLGNTAAPPRLTGHAEGSTTWDGGCKKSHSQL